MITMSTAIAELFVLSGRSVHMETGLKQRRRRSGYENVAKKKMNFHPFKYGPFFPGVDFLRTSNEKGKFVLVCSRPP